MTKPLIRASSANLLLPGTSGVRASGLNRMWVDQSPLALVKAIVASIRGRLGIYAASGVRVEQSDLVRFESEHSDLILDGEEFHALTGEPDRPAINLARDVPLPRSMSDMFPLVASELAELVDERVLMMAQAIAAQHGEASRAVLFYGSCLRQRELDGLMLDFYLIVSDYTSAYTKKWLATANRWIPPNVFPIAHNGLVAKYAVLSEADFFALNGIDATTVSVWARFAQPTRLVWAADDAAQDAVVAAVAQAAPTLLALARPMADSPDCLAIWRTGFALTYNAELRAERKNRSGSIVDADPDHYLRFGQVIPPTIMSRAEAESRWRRLKRSGKLISIVRLAKASFTFVGGIDYLAWKINRHAGTRIFIKPWQRRWPLLGAMVLLPRLLLQGAIR